MPFDSQNETKYNRSCALPYINKTTCNPLKDGNACEVGKACCCQDDFCNGPIAPTTSVYTIDSTTSVYTIDPTTTPAITAGKSSPIAAGKSSPLATETTHRMGTSGSAQCCQIKIVFIGLVVGVHLIKILMSNLICLG